MSTDKIAAVLAEKIAGQRGLTKNECNTPSLWVDDAEELAEALAPVLRELQAKAWQVGWNTGQGVFKYGTLNPYKEAKP